MDSIELMLLKSTPVSNLSKVYIVYFACFILLLEFPFLHGFPGNADSAVNAQSGEIHSHGSEEPQENVRHFHSFSELSYQICFLCALNASLFTNYLDSNNTNYNSGSSILQFSWDESNQSINLKHLPLLRAPPVV